MEKSNLYLLKITFSISPKRGKEFRVSKEQIKQLRSDWIRQKMFSQQNAFILILNWPGYQGSFHEWKKLLKTFAVATLTIIVKEHLFWR